jgi:hypothetical protein
MSEGCPNPIQGLTFSICALVQSQNPKITQPGTY